MCYVAGVVGGGVVVDRSVDDSVVVGCSVGVGDCGGCGDVAGAAVDVVVVGVAVVGCGVHVGVRMMCVHWWHCWCCCCRWCGRCFLWCCVYSRYC